MLTEILSVLHRERDYFPSPVYLVPVVFRVNVRNLNTKIFTQLKQ